MSLTPAEQAEMAKATEEYEARQARLAAEHKAGRYAREHAAWMLKLATLGDAAVDLPDGTQATQLLVDGQWLDGRWTFTRSAYWWVDDHDRGIVQHSAVKGWRLARAATPSADPFAPMRELRALQPAPDCASSLDIVQAQSDVNDAGQVEEVDGTWCTALTASDSTWCGECEHTIPLAAEHREPFGDVLVFVEHDTRGRLLTS